MRLLTDYAQYYDALFDAIGPVFERRAFGRGGLTKREQFALFQRLGLLTPPYGTVADLADRLIAPRIWGASLAPWWDEEIYLIVYEDELAHAGEGKKRLSLARARRDYPSAWASVYLPPARRALTFRHLRIGRIGLWLRQEGGAEEWRSNRGDTETVLTRTRHPEPPIVRRVLWAIDFIPSPDGLLAIDFNTAPEMATVGECRALTAEEIHEELAFAAQQQPESLRQF